MANKNNISRLMSQITQKQTKAFFFVFHVKYLWSNEMAWYIFTTIARTEVRFKVMKARKKKQTKKKKKKKQTDNKQYTAEVRQGIFIEGFLVFLPPKTDRK